MALLLQRLSPLSSSSLPIANPSKSENRRRRNYLRHTIHTGCRASWQELAGVLVFSAIPFTAVKAIANSSVGERLRGLEERKTEDVIVRRAPEFRELTAKAKEQRDLREKMENMHSETQ